MDYIMKRKISGRQEAFEVKDKPNLNKDFWIIYKFSKFTNISWLYCKTFKTFICNDLTISSTNFFGSYLQVLNVSGNQWLKK
jgi:hypothetical protein